MKHLIQFFSFVLFFSFPVIAAFSQNGDGTDYQKALEDIDLIESQERFIDDLSSLGGNDNNLRNLPLGISKNVGNIQIILAVSNIKFGNTYGEATVYAKIKIPNKSKTLMFGASGVRMSAEGDFIGDVKLSLLKDVPLSLGNAGNIIFKGHLNKDSGTAESDTYVMLDCSGSFKELSIDANVVLNENTFKAKDEDNNYIPVIASFRTVVTDWNDLMAEVNFPAFEISGLPDFEFTLSNVVLDLSDKRNSSSFSPPSNYMQSPYFTLPDVNLWRGIYAETIQIRFPEQFKNKTTNQRITVGASHFLIDENGVTADIFGQNVLPIESGDMSGWAFSVTDFKLSLLANNIKGLGFGGQISIPLSEKTSLRTYEAYISNNEYLFNVTLGEDMDFNLFGDTKLKIDPTSYVHIELKDKQFFPKLVLNGSMELNTQGLHLEEVAFKKLTLATQSPVFSVESIEYGGEVKLYNFPITISDIRFTALDNLASLGFDLKVNLMKNNIAASSRLKMESERIDTNWKFKGLSVDAIKLEKVQMAGFSLDGEIRVEKDHPVFGDYFGGEIKATIGALGDGVKIEAAAVFGKKELQTNDDLRYWYVEGKANFTPEVPVGPINISGFNGGIYYRVSATGRSGLAAYAPNKDVSLGLKAGVAYSIATKSMASGDALFEINFRDGGGINNIKFYGTAEFMPVTKLTNRLAALEEMYKDAQAGISNLADSYASNVPLGMSGSDVAKTLLPNVKLSAVVSAYLSMNYEFQTKTFDANFKVMVNAPGSFIKGAGSNNEAGWAWLHTSPQSWFVHLGKPSNPIGLKIGLGPISLSTKSYFMMGDGLEKPLPPDSRALNILGITAEQADFLKSPQDMGAGKGIAFGSRFDFDTGNLTFLILYARFMAGAGFDIMLKDMSNLGCEGSTTPVGINGWYAGGQCYAYLSGELGVKIKILFIKKKITIISGSTAALLQARFPNPTWIGGNMAINFNILGGLIKSNMKMKFSFGDDCKLVSLNGDNTPLDLPVIADLTPVMGDKDVDVFVIPQATFNMAVGTSFDIQDEDGKDKTYRIKLEDFSITDNKGQKIQGKQIWNRMDDAVSFESKEILPPNVDLKVSVAVNFEEKVNGNWQTVYINGKPARESRIAEFKTGTAPNYIPLTNIQYCYPVVDQKNFYKNEYANGYIQLKRGQEYLFPDNFIYNTVFATKDNNQSKADFKYDKVQSRIDYSFPTLNNKVNYELSFVASTQTTSSESGTSKEKAVTSDFTDAEGESFTLDYMQQAAQAITKEGGLEVLKYEFRSSEYNTLEQKLSTIDFEPGSYKVLDDARSLLLIAKNKYELFDEIELMGSSYAENKPLISIEAILTDNYYTKDIAPLIYDGYPISGIKISNRNVNIYGVPPTKAFPFYTGYSNILSSGTADMEWKTRLLPYVYELSYYYYNDYHDLKTKAINSFDKGIDLEPLKPLKFSTFLFMRKGDYKAAVKYTLPGGKESSTKEINYINTIDWRGE